MAKNINNIANTNDLVKMKMSAAGTTGNPSKIPIQPADKLPQMPEITRQNDFLSFFVSRNNIKIKLTGLIIAVNLLIGNYLFTIVN